MKLKISIIITNICIILLFMSLNIQAITITNLKEIIFDPGRLDGSLLKLNPVDIISPQWNLNGTMLAVLIEDDSHEAKLKVYKIIETKHGISANEIYTFPHDDKTKDNNYLPPDTSTSNIDHRRTINMVSWAVDQVNILVFQYKDYIYCANPESNYEKKYNLSKSYREYPKLINKTLIYGKSGAIMNFYRKEKILFKQPKRRASNPVPFTKNSFFFEIRDQFMNIGIYYSYGSRNDCKKIIDFPTTGEILPTFSPDKKLIAFISNTSNFQRSIEKYSSQHFQRNQWAIYAANISLKNDISNKCLPVSNARVKLNFLYGHPKLNWFNNNSLLYISEKESKLYLSALNRNRFNSQEVKFNTKVGTSEIIYIEEISYNIKKNIIALCARRKGYECANNKKIESCKDTHSRIFIGKLSQ